MICEGKLVAGKAGGNSDCSRTIDTRPERTKIVFVKEIMIAVCEEEFDI